MRPRSLGEKATSGVAFSPRLTRHALPARMLAAAAATAAAVALVAAPSAGALTVGLDAYGPLASPQLSVSGPWLNRAARENAGLVRVGVEWSAVAPSQLPKGFEQGNPGSRYYSWSATDALVRNLAARRFTLLIVITGAPRWAEGAHRPADAPPGTWRPSAQDFGRFARAAAQRYSGHYPDPLHPGQYLPRVRYWEAWNEPNLSVFLTPQWTRQGKSYVAASPGTYRGLLNAFYRAVKGLSTGNVVVGGATAPFGDLKPSASLTARMQPVPFVEDLLCLHGSQRLARSSCPHPAHLDALDHHPYDIGSPYQHAVNAGDVSVPDMGKLGRLLRAARRFGTVLPRATKGLWATELAWASRPPDRQGVPLSRQARWLEEALYVLWRQGVRTACWLEIADDSGRNGLDAGLYFAGGRPKPAARAFRFPFVVFTQKSRPVRLWARSPAAGTLLIQRLGGGHWVTIRRQRVGRFGIFRARISLRGHPTLRAKVAGQTSLSWAKA